MPLVNEANLIGTELGRNITFSVKMVKEIELGGNEGKTEVMIRADNKEDGWYGMWNTDKFESRVQMMREVLNEYFDTEVKPSFEDKSKDPWWDPVEPINVGTSYLGLRPLTYAMGTEEMTAKILSSEGKSGQRGFLKVELDVTDLKGNPVDEDVFEDVEDKNDLLGKEFNFRVDINEVQGLPDDLCTNPFATYSLKYEPNVT